MRWIILLLVLILISGCKQTIEENDTQGVADVCVKACEDALAEGRNLENGPCLLNPMTDTNWVCDVAHSPRQPVDNKAENQCSAFREGIASHFVEVTPECELIKVV